MGAGVLGDIASSGLHSKSLGFIFVTPCKVPKLHSQLQALSASKQI